MVHTAVAEPLIVNFDQSPFHNNETGSQDKPTLSVRGSTVPIVEGNSDVKMRWTANLSTVSRFTAVAGGKMPFCEVMFRASSQGPVYNRLQKFLRESNFPDWFTVTTAPRGSYREEDIIEYMKKHLEEWHEGRDWRILLADDFSAHKTENVFQLAWSRGYVLLVHGGGATPVSQTCDTDLNEHVRRDYGAEESLLLIEKMRNGEVVPSLKPEECMKLMLRVLSNPELHERASAGYIKTGQSIDLWGKEDALIQREAATFWNEETTDGHATMRGRINQELTAVADEVHSGRLTWNQRNVRRLITPYPKRPEVDKVLENLGEDFYHDDCHKMLDDELDVAKAEDLGENDSDSEQEEPAVADAPMADDDKAAASLDINAVADAPLAVEGQGESMALKTSLSASQADKVHLAEVTIAEELETQTRQRLAAQLNN